jgi:group II intron reverse transcriptase/maturase
MQIRQADQHMQTSLQGIAKRAKEDPKHRFGNLYSLLNEDNLRWCVSKLNRKAAAGVDQIDWVSFEENLDENVSQLAIDLKEKRYKAKHVRRSYIPKPGGKQRPLGIPVIGDKLVQTAVSSILVAIFEQDFLDCSHGYRRGKGPQRAALELSQRLQRGRFRWIFDADIRGFFDNIDHDWLLRMLEQRIEDKAFLGLIQKWLKAGILEEDKQVILPVTGTPQGGVVSAVLANVYLHYVLDLWFEKIVKPRCDGDALLMRFADDYVCCFQYHRDLQKLHRVMAKRLGKFNLELAMDKTRVIEFTRFKTKNSMSFIFLGFEFRWGLSRNNKPLVKMRTAKMKFQLALAAMTKWIKLERYAPDIVDIMDSLSAKLLGHFNYYGVSGNMDMLTSYYHYSCRIVFKWLNRRSQRKSYNWHGFCELLKQFQIPQPRIIGYWS